MSQLFQTYEQDFVKALASTQRKLQSLTTQTTLKQQLAFSDIKLQLTEVDKCLKFMQTQAGSLPPHTRPKFQEKVSKHKRQYNEIKRKIYRKQEEYAEQKNKQTLMGARIDEEHSQKEKFIGEGQLLSDATYKLKDSVSVMRQTEGISNDVEVELVNHTDRLNKNKEKLLVIDGDLSESQKLISRMSAIIRRNKLVLGVVVGAIILAGIILTAMLIIKKNKAEGASGSASK